MLSKLKDYMIKNELILDASQHMQKSNEEGIVNIASLKDKSQESSMLIQNIRSVFCEFNSEGTRN
ncbi:hypothetical protein OL548_02380 [Lysinibacillus sp. MHQ-1]|nr:hypothetical protein OL548_02380 [Lysinibacillus sp. MHQ-1]